MIPICAPPWAILNLTVCGLSLTYFCASNDTSGYDAVAPLIEIVGLAEAAAGAATPSAPAIVRATERRRIRFIEQGLRFWVFDNVDNVAEHIIIPIDSIQIS